METLKKPWVIPIILTLFLMAVGGFLLMAIMTDEEPLSEEAIYNHLIELYGGEIVELKKNGDIYQAEMKKNGATIEAQIDSISGSVISLNEISAAPTPKQEILSEEDIRNKVAQNFNGEIQKIMLNKDEKAPFYQIELSDQQSLTSLTVDALSGTVIAESKTETTPPEQQQVLISKERAIEIAQGRMKGEVDYISYKKTDDGGYYLLEIDGEEDEATFQIHAISGEILSITNDEDDDDDGG